MRTRRRFPSLLATLGLLCACAGAFGPVGRAQADEAPAAPAEPTEEERKAAEEAARQPHADADVEQALERYAKDEASDQADVRLRILKWLGMYRHKKVLKELRSVWTRSKDVELQAVAAEGLGNQTAHARDAARALLEGLEKYEEYATREEPLTERAEEVAQVLEARALANALRALARLGHVTEKREFKLVAGFVDHNHDDVCIAALDYFGAVKEWRALPVILEWFNFYPDGYSWAGGSVTVDTGAAGDKDAKAARAGWQAKYGSRARKARPAAHEAMRRALKAITGQDFTKAEELKAWMKDNKALLKKHGV